MRKNASLKLQRFNALTSQRFGLPTFARVLLLLACLQLTPVFAADPKSEELVRQGNAAFKKGDRPGAIEFFTQAIALDPSNHTAYYNRGRLHDHEGRWAPALADYDEYLKLRPENTTILQLRGALHLRLGHFQEALTDFNRYLELMPKTEPQHWQRGIAYYYLGRYEDGRRQFEQCHRTNTNDIEHTLWHFACVARSNGLEKARASLLPAGKDPRSHFNSIHSFYAGKRKAEDVLAEAKSGRGVENPLRFGQAHFYLGLFYEATGKESLASEHMAKAAQQGPKGDLICDLARIKRKRGTDPSNKD